MRLRTQAHAQVAGFLVVVVQPAWVVSQSAENHRTGSACHVEPRTIATINASGAVLPRRPLLGDKVTRR